MGWCVVDDASCPRIWASRSSLECGIVFGIRPRDVCRSFIRGRREYLEETFQHNVAILRRVGVREHACSWVRRWQKSERGVFNRIRHVVSTCSIRFLRRDSGEIEAVVAAGKEEMGCCAADLVWGNLQWYSGRINILHCLQGVNFLTASARE